MENLTHHGGYLIVSWHTVKKKSWDDFPKSVVLICGIWVWFKIIGNLNGYRKDYFLMGPLVHLKKSVPMPKSILFFPHKKM